MILDYRQLIEITNKDFEQGTYPSEGFYKKLKEGYLDCGMNKEDYECIWENIPNILNMVESGIKNKKIDKGSVDYFYELAIAWIPFETTISESVRNKVFDTYELAMKSGISGGWDANLKLYGALKSKIDEKKFDRFIGMLESGFKNDEYLKEGVIGQFRNNSNVLARLSADNDNIVSKSGYKILNAIDAAVSTAEANKGCMNRDIFIALNYVLRNASDSNEISGRVLELTKRGMLCRGLDSADRNKVMEAARNTLSNIAKINPRLKPEIDKLQQKSDLYYKVETRLKRVRDVLSPNKAKPSVISRRECSR